MSATRAFRIGTVTHFQCPRVLAGESRNVAMEIAFILAGSVVVAGLAALLFQLVRHLVSPRPLPATAGWIDELSIDRYRPMLRLLDPAELDFLRAQPGFKPGMESRHRTQRARLFREYLRSLEDDFGNICEALKILMVQSAHDRPDLASILLRNQVSFAYGLTLVQVRLLGYRYGLGTVDIGDLLKAFDGLRLELRTLVPCEQGAAA